MTKNTVLFIDPRKIDHIVPILNEYYKLIGSNWNYVFYCGKGTVDYWKHAPFTEALQNILELRRCKIAEFFPPETVCDKCIEVSREETNSPCIHMLC